MTPYTLTMVILTVLALVVLSAATVCSALLLYSARRYEQWSTIALEVDRLAKQQQLLDESLQTYMGRENMRRVRAGRKQEQESSQEDLPLTREAVLLKAQKGA